MKPRLLLLLLTAGVITGLLLVIENPSQSEATVKQTNPLSASHPISTSSLQPTLALAKTNSANAKTLDLIKQIREALKSRELAAHDLVFNNLLPDLIKRDPYSAASLAESLEAGPSREEMLRRVAQHWTEQNPASAKQWAEQLADMGERNSTLTDVCTQIAQTNPQEAIQMADQLGLGTLPGAILENLVQQWAAKDLAAAAAWVEERPAGEQKDQMLSRIAIVQAKTSPVEAAQMVVEEIPDGNTRTEAVVSVVYQWAQRDLPGARAWVELFPEGALRERALNELKGAEQYQTASQH